MKRNRIIKAFPSLDFRRLAARRIAEDPILGTESIRLYASGRSALFHIVASMKLPPDSVILVPSYHCGVEVEAVLRSGCGVGFYRIREDMSIDRDDLVSRIDRRTRGIVVAHFFGFPQELKELQHICRENEILLIEDCAHALYSRTDSGEWLGTRGDYGIFSMRKTVCLPNGGAALVNSTGCSEPVRGTGYFNGVLLKSTIKSVMEHERSRAGLLGSFSGWLLDRHASRNRSDAADNPKNRRWYYDVPSLDYRHGISALSSPWTGKEDFREIIHRRRRNYQYLEFLLRDRRADKFVFPRLPEKTCPLCFPLIVRERDRVAADMEAMGVEPFIFGRTFHPMIRAEDFPEASALAQGVIGLPIHQQLTPGDMTLVAEALFASWIE